MASITQWFGSFYGTLEYSESNVSASNNTSTVNATLKIGSNSYGSFYGYTTYGTIIIDGSRYSVSTSANLGTNSSITVGSASKTIAHNSDGSKSISIGFELSNGYAGSTSGSGTMGLTKINRYAHTSAFNISKTDNQYDFEKSMSVNYDKYSASGYSYKLRISIQNVKQLQLKDYNTSGASFYLDDTSLNQIYDYAYQNNLTSINLGARVETWSGSSRKSEGNEIVVTCPILPKGRIYINGEWKRAQAYYGVNGEWKRATPYIGSNGSWKRSK